MSELDLNMVLPGSKIRFMRDELHAAPRPVTMIVKDVKGDKTRRYLLPRCFRLTVAYEPVAVERKAKDRDPAFVVRCGLAFCDVFGPDAFTKNEGRKTALKHLAESPVEVRLYVGQTVLATVYAALAKKSPGVLRKLHVPQRMIPLFRALRKQKQAAPPARCTERSRTSRFARQTYNDAITHGMSRDEAIALCRKGA